MYYSTVTTFIFFRKTTNNANAHVIFFSLQAMHHLLYCNNEVHIYKITSTSKPEEKPAREQISSVELHFQNWNKLDYPIVSRKNFYQLEDFKLYINIKSSLLKVSAQIDIMV